MLASMTSESWVRFVALDTNPISDPVVINLDVHQNLVPLSKFSVATVPPHITLPSISLCKLVMCTSRSSLFSCFFRQISHTKCLVLLCILSLALKYFLPGILKGQYLQLLKVTSALTLDILSLVPSLFGVPFFLLSIVLHSDSTSDSTSW